MIDYKINKITDDGNSKQIDYSIYSGNISTENEMDPKTGSLISTTRYRRISKLATNRIIIPKGVDYKRELDMKLSALGIQAIPEQKI